MGIGIAGHKGRLIVKLLAWAMVLCAGVSISYRPSYEILFNPWTVDGGCYEAGCVRIYILEIGNTGWNDQAEVSVEVRSHWLELAQLPPKAAMFGKVPRPMRVEYDGDNAKWFLGGLQSGKRIDVRFTLSSKVGEPLPTWDDILVGVRSASGSAQKGPPELTTFGRFLTAFFG